MDNVAQQLAFVNEQVAFHQKKARQFSGVAGKEWRQKLHLTTAVRFQQLAEFIGQMQAELEAARQPPAAPPPRTNGPVQLSLSLEEVKDLPEELIKELSISDSDRTDFAITSIIDDAGGVITLDRLLIALYKRTGEVFKRQALTNRLYRMGQKGLVFGVSGKKGLYATRELTPEEVATLG